MSRKSKRLHSRERTREAQSLAIELLEAKVEPKVQQIEIPEDTSLIDTALAEPDEPTPLRKEREIAPAKSYSSPNPSEEEQERGFRIRRTVRLTPAQKPLNWFDELEKHCPL